MKRFFRLGIEGLCPGLDVKKNEKFKINIKLFIRPNLDVWESASRF